MSNWTDVAAEADLFDGAGISVLAAGRDSATGLGALLAAVLSAL